MAGLRTHKLYDSGSTIEIKYAERSRKLDDTGWKAYGRRHAIYEKQDENCEEIEIVA